MKQLLDTLSQEERKTLPSQRFRNGQIIFHEDEICDSVGVLISGSVEISSYSFSGQEIVYNVLEEGGLFGNNLLFSDSSRFRGNVISKGSSEIAFLKKEILVKLLQTNREFLEEYLRIQSNFGKSLNMKIKILSFESAEERFSYYLFTQGGTIHYQNVTSLAKTLSLQRETLSRLLSKLEKSGSIFREKHEIKKI